MKADGPLGPPGTGRASRKRAAATAPAAPNKCAAIDVRVAKKEQTAQNLRKGSFPPSVHPTVPYRDRGLAPQT